MPADRTGAVADGRDKILRALGFLLALAVAGAAYPAAIEGGLPWRFWGAFGLLFISNFVFPFGRKDFFASIRLSAAMFLLNIALLIYMLFELGERSDFFILFALAILVTTVIRRLIGAVVATILVGLLYALLTLHRAPDVSLLSVDFLTRIAFIFVFSLFIAHLADEATRARQAVLAGAAKLRDAEERYQALFERSLDCLYVHDFEGNFIDANPAAINLLGYEKQEIPALNFTHLIDTAQLPRAFQVIEELRATGKQKEITEFRLRRKNGEYVDVETKASLVFREGNPYAIQGIARDITERKRAEESLRESENRFKTLSSLASEGIMLHEGGVVLDANPAFAELAGYSNPDDLTGKNGLEILPFTAESRQRVLDHMRAGSTETYEIELVKPDGSILTAETHGRETIYRGRPARLISLRDITERKRAEEALRESEVRFRSLVETAPDAVFVQSGGRFIYLNQALFRLLGASRVEDLLGTEFMERIAPDYHEAIRERIRIQRETKKPVPLMDLEYLRLDGSRVQVETTAAPIRYQGRDAHLVFARDITNRKRAEAELQKLALIVRHSSELVTLATPDGKMVFLNEAGARMLGIDPDKVEQVHIMQVIPEHLKDEVQNKLLPTLRANGKWEGELQYQNLKTGRRIDVYASAFTITDPRTGAPLYLANVSHDITDRKELEEEVRHMQKMEAIGTLAGGVAHDFNNILAGILGYSNRLKLESQPGSPVFQSADVIERAADRAAQLTRQLLGFARKGKFQNVPLDLHAVIQDVITIISRTIDQRISIVQTLAARPSTVLGDPSQLQQVILNLAVNARDAMPEGGGALLQYAIIRERRGCSEEHGGPSPRPVPHPFHHGHGARHPQGDSTPHLRALFHHEGNGEGHGNGAGHGLRHREEPSGRDRLRQRDRPGDHFHPAAPAPRRRHRCRPPSRLRRGAPPRARAHFGGG